MAKYKMVRLAETPYWAQSSEFNAIPGKPAVPATAEAAAIPAIPAKVEIQREGQDVHLYFNPPKSGYAHIVVPWSACSYGVPEDELPPKDSKK